ncbi:hypothetical protein BHU24_16590 [Bacillus pseudomycoides]|uniref:hypothetical protein n=2 Tax=Bacillus pseudomycoides TaxID=64104 RepID=UPI000BEDD069|nr:hypothetical protein [Bacillus pseudomycoides]MBD5797772.1 hypothetical protein [Bacillus pseudomycoides]PDZ12289.1 hypothetical protein CON70_07165 [Bacillus pseudomycoides]PEO78784.1 hypothetical protein CN571_28735 [Bacillus pseudomycoides]PEP88586.1 hypothetical protein CN584_00180 [Bacillus pseudomycoides]PFW97424.1 hypothetical protein COL29_03765 [Bacillus pseudomycoides]
MNFVKKWGMDMKDVKIEYIENKARITVDGKEIAFATNTITKKVAEKLLINLDQAGAINLIIEN